jgi:hypothetical protein
MIAPSVIGLSSYMAGVKCHGYIRKSNDVCRVGGFTTNSKPIVKIHIFKYQFSLILDE